MTDVKIGNPELLKLAVKNIEADLLSWDQHHWGRIVDPEAVHRLIPTEWDAFNSQMLGMMPEGVTCGTAMCLAGQVVSTAGFPLLFDPLEETADYCMDRETGEKFQVQAKAKELLGMDDRTAGKAFSGVAARYRLNDRDQWVGPDLEGDSIELEEDSIELFKENLTSWTGVQFD